MKINYGRDIFAELFIKYADKMLSIIFIPGRF